MYGELEENELCFGHPVLEALRLHQLEKYLGFFAAVTCLSIVLKITTLDLQMWQ